MCAQRAQETWAEPAGEGGRLGGGCKEQNTQPWPSALTHRPVAMGSQGCHTSSSHNCLPPPCMKPTSSPQGPQGPAPVSPSHAPPLGGLTTSLPGHPVKQGRQTPAHALAPRRLGAAGGPGKTQPRGDSQQGQQTRTQDSASPHGPLCGPSWQAWAQTGLTAGRPSRG